MKIGDKVKVVRALDRIPIPFLIGEVGTIVEAASVYDWRVLLDSGNGAVLFYSSELVPLTDDDESFQRFMTKITFIETPLVMCARSLDTTGEK